MESEIESKLLPKVSKSCDNCKNRKVRCIMGPQGGVTCVNCIRRHETCHFSQIRKRAKAQRRTALDAQYATRMALSAHYGFDNHILEASLPTSMSMSSASPSLNSERRDSAIAQPPPVESNRADKIRPAVREAPLYIDLLLQNRGTSARLRNNSIVKAHGQIVGSSGLAWFSEGRISAISDLLGHNKLKDLIDKSMCIISDRSNMNGHSLFPSIIKFRHPSNPERVAPETAALYIEAYFEQIHPVYPFLDKDGFMKKVTSSELSYYIESCPSFSALYHTVLALGCQYRDGGAFDPYKGKSWKLFQVALGLMPEILVPKESLVNLQALTAMCIFAMNMACVQVDQMMITETARMAQTMGYHRVKWEGEEAKAGQRTFWVIYVLEKNMCFHYGINSIIADYDIGCPVPDTPEAILGGFNWLLAAIQFSRLLSQTYVSLFSISATLNSQEYYREEIKAANETLERWRLEVPEPFRPGEPFQTQLLSDPCSILVALRIAYSYYGFVIAICRLALHIEGCGSSPFEEQTKMRLMNAARMIIELTRYINVEAHSTIFILAIMPLSALFILFDFVVHNPAHPETGSNLALLDVAAGYFSRLEYISGGSLRSSVLSEFSPIARQYVRDVENKIKQERRSSSISTTKTAYPDPFSSPVNETKQQPFTPECNSIPSMADYTTENLFYPLVGIQGDSASGPGELTDGFDFRSLFGAVIPGLGGPWEDTFQGVR